MPQCECKLARLSTKYRRARVALSRLTRLSWEMPKALDQLHWSQATMAISSNPPSSTRKSAQTGPGSRHPQSLDYLVGAAVRAIVASAVGPFAALRDRNCERAGRARKRSLAEGVAIVNSSYRLHAFTSLERSAETLSRRCGRTNPEVHWPRGCERPPGMRRTG